jgi:uroporphyrinogen-III decarboxylase
MSDIEMVDRVLRDKDGKEVAVVPMVKMATQAEYYGKVYRKKETGEDFFEADEPTGLFAKTPFPK